MKQQAKSCTLVCHSLSLTFFFLILILAGYYTIIITIRQDAGKQKAKKMSDNIIGTIGGGEICVKRVGNSSCCETLKKAKVN